MVRRVRSGPGRLVGPHRPLDRLGADRADHPTVGADDERILARGALDALGGRQQRVGPCRRRPLGRAGKARSRTGRSARRWPGMARTASAVSMARPCRPGRRPGTPGAGGRATWCAGTGRRAGRRGPGAAVRRAFLGRRDALERGDDRGVNAPAGGGGDEMLRRSARTRSLRSPRVGSREVITAATGRPCRPRAVMVASVGCRCGTR